MTWSTKSLNRAREYVVLQHRLRDTNGNIAGVRFRGGYCVVEKNSKQYNTLKSLPLLKGGEEFPLLHLRNLKFITRTSDVRLIFGQDVYYQYIKALNPVVEEEIERREEEKEFIHIEQNKNCSYVAITTGKLCRHAAIPGSPSGYCRIHLLKDPNLSEIGIVLPSKMTNLEEKQFREKILKKLGQ